ncbi:hypothetical protein GCM10010493_84490 [Streptomyces lavendulae subsp. grasserius]
MGRIVIDSPSEIARIAAAVGPGGRQKVMVRVVHGVTAGGHDKIRTGTDDQKFGLSLTDGAHSTRSPGYSVSRSSNSADALPHRLPDLRSEALSSDAAPHGRTDGPCP